MFWRSSNKRRVDPDKAWQQQNSAQQHNMLYKYINLQRQGRLLDVYTAQGHEALCTIIRDELALFLYNDGKGKLLSRTEIKRWKRSCVATTNVRYLRIF